MGIREVELQQRLAGQELLGHCKPGAAIRLRLRVSVVLVRHHRLGDSDGPAAVPDDIADKLSIVVIGDPDLAILVRLLGEVEAGAGVDLDIKGGAREHFLSLTVRLADDDLGVLGVGKDEGGQLGTTADLRGLPVGIIDQIALRGLYLTHLDSPGVLFVVLEELAVDIVVDDDGAVGASGAKAAKIGAVHHDLEHSTGQRLVVAGSNLLDHDFRVGVVYEGESMDEYIVISLSDGNALTGPIRDQIAIGCLDFNKIVSTGLQPIAIGAGEGEGTIAAGGGTVNLGAVQVDVEHGAGQAVAALIHLLDND